MCSQKHCSLPVAVAVAAAAVRAVTVERVACSKVVAGVRCSKDPTVVAVLVGSLASRMRPDAHNKVASATCNAAAAVSLVDNKAGSSAVLAGNLVAGSSAVLADNSAVRAGNSAALADSSAVLADSSAALADSSAALADSSAGLADSSEEASVVTVASSEANKQVKEDWEAREARAAKTKARCRVALVDCVAVHPLGWEVVKVAVTLGKLPTSPGISPTRCAVEGWEDHPISSVVVPGKEELLAAAALPEALPEALPAAVLPAAALPAALPAAMVQMTTIMAKLSSIICSKTCSHNQ